LFQSSRLFLELVLGDGVGLRQRDNLRLVLEPRTIGLHLAADDRVGVSHVVERGIDEMEQHGSALDMAEEAVADATALMCALDQSRDIGEHEIEAIDAHHAEVRVQRGEGIVGDLGLGRAPASEILDLAALRSPMMPASAMSFSLSQI